MSKSGYIFKVAVIGDGAVGKTSLIRKYTKNDFSAEYVMTLGAQITTYDEKIDDTNCRLILWDIAGDEALAKLRPSFYRGTKGAIIVFSHASGQEVSFEHLSSWLSDIRKKSENIPIILFGNKIDLIEEDELSKNKENLNGNVEKFIKENDIFGYYKTSALTGQGVISAFKTLVTKLYNLNN